MAWAVFRSLLLAWCIVIRSSTQCVSRYTTSPIDGFSCQTSVYKNISNIRFHHCIYACIESQTCYTLSYSHQGQYCLLASEPCVTADLSSEFTMMILRDNEPQQCASWIPFSSAHGLQYGFPNRAVHAALSKHKTSVSARATDSDFPLPGRSASDDYQAFFLDSNLTLLKVGQMYEVLVVTDSCSTAWVNYTAGDPVPARAVMAGKDSFNRNLYVAGRHLASLRFGGYIEGEPRAYFDTGRGLRSFKEMILLISLDWANFVLPQTICETDNKSMIDVYGIETSHTTRDHLLRLG